MEGVRAGEGGRKSKLVYVGKFVHVKAEVGRESGKIVNIIHEHFVMVQPNQ